jgi:hypothetical protein
MVPARVRHTEEQHTHFLHDTGQLGIPAPGNRKAGESKHQYQPYIPLAEFHHGIRQIVLQMTKNYNTYSSQL